MDNMLLDPIQIYFAYGTSFLLLGFGLVLKTVPTSLHHLHLPIRYGGAFALLHSVAEFAMMFGLIFPDQMAQYRHFSFLTAGLSFLLLTLSAYHSIPGNRVHVRKIYSFAMIFASVIWTIASLVALTGYTSFESIDVLGRWAIGGPTGLILGIFLSIYDQKSRPTVTPETMSAREKSWLDKRMWIVRFVISIYGVSTFFGSFLPYSPFDVINADSFSVVTGIDVYVFRTVLAFLAAVFVLQMLLHFNRLEELDREQEIAEKTQSLSDLNKQLSQSINTAEKALEAKSRFLASMSHELRTPLNAIIGYGEFLALQLENSLTEKQKDQFVAITDSGRQLDGLLHDLLSLSAIEGSDFDVAQETVSITTALTSAARILTPLAEQKSVVLEVCNECPNDLHAIADSLRLNQVLLNLINNAIKFNRPNGHVYLHWEHTGRNTARVEVRDEGYGIPDSDRERIFTMFERGQQSPYIASDGTGIGLGLCKMLVEKMNGSIGYHNLPEKGCCFWLELPLANSDIQ